MRKMDRMKVWLEEREMLRFSSHYLTRKPLPSGEAEEIKVVSEKLTNTPGRKYHVVVGSSRTVKEYAHRTFKRKVEHDKVKMVEWLREKDAGRFQGSLQSFLEKEGA